MGKYQYNEEEIMNHTEYDKEAGRLYVTVSKKQAEGIKIARTLEVEKDVYADYKPSGELYGIDIPEGLKGDVEKLVEMGKKLAGSEETKGEVRIVQDDEKKDSGEVPVGKQLFHEE